MPWVRFTAAMTWKPTPGLTLVYGAGETRLVTTPCAQAARSAGKAVSVPRPPEGARTASGKRRAPAR